MAAPDRIATVALRGSREMRVAGLEEERQQDWPGEEYDEGEEVKELRQVQSGDVIGLVAYPSQYLPGEFEQGHVPRTTPPL